MVHKTIRDNDKWILFKKEYDKKTTKMLEHLADFKQTYNEELSYRFNLLLKIYCKKMI